MVKGESGSGKLCAAGQGSAMKLAVRVTMLLGAVTLAACQQSVMVRPAPSSSQHSAPKSSRPVVSDGSGYTVLPGDTLYKIAVQYGVDYRDLASWNQISAPYTIYPKQQLRIRSGSDASAALAATAPTASAPVAAPAAAERVGNTAKADSPGYDANLGVTLPEGAEPLSTSSSPVFEPERPDAAAASAASAAAQPVTNAANAASTTVTAAATVAATVPAAATAAVTSSTAVNDATAGKPSAAGWIWPTAGKVAVTYANGDPTRQGIDIVGDLGQPVRAARDGEVVYSGAGLIGYGELVIVKHSPELLSAYGHNRTRLVKEGDKVKAGQQIAEMGKSASNRVLLHFEVRKNGKPVDPMPLLPAR